MMWHVNVLLAVDGGGDESLLIVFLVVDVGSGCVDESLLIELLV